MLNPSWDASQSCNIKKIEKKIINCDERCTIHKIIHIKLKFFNYFDGINFFKKKFKLVWGVEKKTSPKCKVNYNSCQSLHLWLRLQIFKLGVSRAVYFPLHLVTHQIIPTSVACGVGPSVTTSSTDFSFQNLVFFWEFIWIFSGRNPLKNRYLPHSESKSYQINSIKSCSSRTFQQHQSHIPIPPKISATI